MRGLEHSELRAKVGNNIQEGTLVTLAGVNINTSPDLRHAGLLSESDCFIALESLCNTTTNRRKCGKFCRSPELFCTLPAKSLFALIPHCVAVVSLQ